MEKCCTCEEFDWPTHKPVATSRPVSVLAAAGFSALALAPGSGICCPAAAVVGSIVEDTAVVDCRQGCCPTGRPPLPAAGRGPAASSASGTGGVAAAAVSAARSSAGRGFLRR